MYAQTILKEDPVSVTVGICATTERENTVKLTSQIIGLNEEGVNIVEVMVVTPNRKLAEDLKGPPRVNVILETEREGKASALNKIIERASGDILVLASADIRLARTTIPKLVRALASNPERGAVDSRVELVNGDRLLMDRVSTLLWDVHNATLDYLDGFKRLGHVAGDLSAVRRKLVSRLPNVINDDAYLALKVQEKGLFVKRVQDVIVWICGPRTPTDYVLQRSRILQGHLQLIRLSGKVPTTFEFGLLQEPRRSLKILVTAIGRLGPSYLWPLFTAGLLETVSFGVAVSSLVFGRHSTPWRIAYSTKQV